MSKNSIFTEFKCVFSVEEKEQISANFRDQKWTKKFKREFQDWAQYYLSFVLGNEENTSDTSKLIDLLFIAIFVNENAQKTWNKTAINRKMRRKTKHILAESCQKYWKYDLVTLPDGQLLRLQYFFLHFDIVWSMKPNHHLVHCVENVWRYFLKWLQCVYGHKSIQ